MKDNSVPTKRRRYDAAFRAEALRLAESGTVVGKVVLRPAR